MLVQDGGYVRVGDFGANERSEHAGQRKSAQFHNNPPCESVVGTGRFELPTCRLGGDRSIHLSYVPANPFYYSVAPP